MPGGVGGLLSDGEPSPDWGIQVTSYLILGLPVMFPELPDLPRSASNECGVPRIRLGQLIEL